MLLSQEDGCLPSPASHHDTHRLQEQVCGPRAEGTTDTSDAHHDPITFASTSLSFDRRLTYSGCTSWSVSRVGASTVGCATGKFEP
jgi:hypothetical protein